MYDPNTGLFWWKLRGCSRRFDRPIGSVSSQGYIIVRYKNIGHKAHRVAWVIMKGRWPKLQIDHKDTNPSNNKWNNLRLATRTQNKRNGRCYKNNKTGIKGVHTRSGRSGCQSSIRVNRKLKYLGSFATLEEAAAAYAVAAKKYFGEFARTA